MSVHTVSAYAYGEEVRVSGRIREDVIVAIRERLPLDQVVADYVALKPAGAGRLKGLCPFHDEKTPSFNVNAALGFYKCFGCSASGDAITFVRELEHLSFTEAVEVLARKAGVEVTYEQGSAAPRQQGSQRQRLLDAHREAAAYYVEHLGSPEAEIGRAFLRERGFDEAAWARFGVGYAPTGWEGLTTHLRAKGFTNDEMLAGGLATQGQRGTPYDRFRGRLVWPIRDMKGDVIGFGARRLREDDTGPKYLNTPETPLYKKSQVLYGVDLAKNDIATRYKAVVVEGYTDVMACHLAGETTAVATCGTAFGAEHVQVLRRLLMDQDEFRGRVIFTFDGDEAGQKAALKAFADDQRFVTQLFVAVQPDGFDPCELRQQRGDLAVRDLIASHVPLAEFAIRSALARFDLEIPEGRVSALAAAAPVVATLKDWSLRDEYARRLAGWLGMDEQSVLARVRGGASGGRASSRSARPRPHRRTRSDEARGATPRVARPRIRRARCGRVHGAGVRGGAGSAGEGGRYGDGGRRDRVGDAGARRGRDRCGARPRHRARGRGGAERRRGRPALRIVAGRPAGGDGAHPPDTRVEGPVAAAQSGRPGDRVQPRVRRADRARTAEEGAARARGRRGLNVDADGSGLWGTLRV
jgi:DNA primase